MNRFRIIFFSIGSLLVVNCGSTKSTKEPNLALQKLIEGESFKIEVNAVHPQPTQAVTQLTNAFLTQQGNSVGRINLTNSGYFLRVKGDSVSANLPFFGERQMGGGYNNNVGIIFDGVTKNLEITPEEDSSYKVKFDIRSDSEVYNITAQIFNNYKSSLMIWSSHRNQIRYTGSVEALEE